MAKSRPLMQKCMAEFLGVFILCLIGNGSVAETLVKWDDSWRMHSFTGLQTFFFKNQKPQFIIIVGQKLNENFVINETL